MGLFLPDDATTRIALQYYHEFKARVSKVNITKLDYYFKAAFLISEKSQYIENLQGEKIRNFTFSMNEIIKNTTNMQEMISVTREFLKYVTIVDKESY